MEAALRQGLDDDFDPKGPIWSSQAPGTSSDVRFAACVTLYNEPLEQLSRSICSVGQSLSHALYRGAGQSDVALVCILADGAAALSPTTRAWVEHVAQEGDEQHWPQVAGIRIVELPGHLLPQPERVAAVEGRQAPGRVRLVLVLKEANAGKLHSHEVFFRSICHRANPEFCFQIDAGTEVAEDAIARLSEALDARPDLAGIAPTVLVPRPENANILLLWQYFGFLMQRAVSWPFEVMTGYLSVLPGQFSVLRWSALTRMNSRGQTPLDFYLRSPDQHSATEKLMYLAEDRVIGMQLVLAEGARSEIEFDPGVRSQTDSCTTWMELARQRRRWNNSTLVCRLWMVKQSAAFFRRADRNIGDKAWFSLSVLAMLLLLVLDIALPAIVVCTLASLIRVFAHGLLSGAAKSMCAAGTAGLFISVSLLRMIGPWPDRDLKSRLKAVAEVLFLPFSFAETAALVTGAPWYSAALVALPVISANIALYAICRILGVRVNGNYVLYVLATPFINLGLWLYSLLRLNDVSWGTKGLVSARAGTVKRDLDRIRLYGLTAWIVINSGLIAAGLLAPGFTWFELNPVFEAACAGIGLVAFGGCCRTAWYLMSEHSPERRIDQQPVGTVQEVYL